jgi:membrane protein YqaA with SNARE-associated domain
VIGGCLGYAIGALLYDSVGHWVIDFYHMGDKVEAFRESYARWGALIILLKGLTPIPYKLVTITSGFAGYNFGLFILFSIITRGARFFIEAVVLNRWGDWIRERIERHLTLWVILFLVVLVAGFIVAFRML